MTAAPKRTTTPKPSNRTAAVRDPLPEGLPRTVADRLAALDHSSWLVATDAHGTATDMAGNGWTGAALDDGLEGYRAWWHSLVDGAVGTRFAFWKAAA